MNTCIRLLGYLALCLLVAIGAMLPGASASADEPAPQGRATVVWISIDGCRSDYADKFNAPYFKSLMSTGAFSRQLTPIFPSITFPNHTAQATGTTCDEHGIVNNQFRDTALREVYTHPNPQGLMRAEPIWATATRQGIRCAVEDWPISYFQSGPSAAAYFNKAEFDHDVTDDDRVGRLIKDWKSDAGQPAIRLFMGYIPSVDVSGHRYGPDSERTKAVFLSVDKAIQVFHEQAIARFKATAKPDDSLYFIISADHGMSNVTKVVNLFPLLGAARDPRVAIVVSGPIGNIYFDDVPEAQRPAVIGKTFAGLAGHDFMDVYQKKDLPERWHYNAPSRTGEIVVVLKKDYTFTLTTKTAVESVVPGEAPGGAHGYPVEENPEMLGLLIISRYPKPFGGKDLGAVSHLQLHPTVAKLLGIQQSDKAKGSPLDLN